MKTIDLEDFKPQIYISNALGHNEFVVGDTTDHTTGKAKNGIYVCTTDAGFTPYSPLLMVNEVLEVEQFVNEMTESQEKPINAEKQRRFYQELFARLKCFGNDKHEITHMMSDTTGMLAYMRGIIWVQDRPNKALWDARGRIMKYNNIVFQHDFKQPHRYDLIIWDTKPFSETWKAIVSEINEKYSTNLEKEETASESVDTYTEAEQAVNELEGEKDVFESTDKSIALKSLISEISNTIDEYEKFLEDPKYLEEFKACKQAFLESLNALTTDDLNKVYDIFLIFLTELQDRIPGFQTKEIADLVTIFKISNGPTNTNETEQTNSTEASETETQTETPVIELKSKRGKKAEKQQ